MLCFCQCEMLYCYHVIFDCVITWTNCTNVKNQLTNINSLRPSDAYMCQWTRSALFQIMACRLIGAKPLPKPMLTYCQLDPKEQTSFVSKYKTLNSRQCIWKHRLQNDGHFIQDEMINVKKFPHNISVQNSILSHAGAFYNDYCPRISFWVKI